MASPKVSGNVALAGECMVTLDWIKRLSKNFGTGMEMDGGIGVIRF